MKFGKAHPASLALILLIYSLGRAAPWQAAAAASAQADVPGPAQVFTPHTALAFYADLESASKTAIWKSIGEKAGPQAELFQSLHQGQLDSLRVARVVPWLNETNVAEFALALEGDKVLSDIQSEKFDPSSGFLAVLRLTQTQDTDALVRQALEAIDKEKPGLRAEMEKSRRRVGAAEFFDLPAAALGEQKLPFTLSCAVGPGRDGTIVCLGRSENLSAYLSGKTAGQLRGQVNEALARRGQFWLYLMVPKEAAKNLAGSGGLNANPMLAGLGESMDKVRDVTLSLNFAPRQIDFELDLACADNSAAAQIAQGIQGFLGMIQLGAKQNPASMPPFVGKIKAAAEAATFRLTTAITMRDIELAFQNVNRGAVSARPRASTPGPKPEAEVPEARTPPPVEVEFVQFNSEEEESLRQGRMRVHNRSHQPVKEINLTFTYSDQSGRKLGQWTRTHSSLQTPNLVGADTSEVVECLAFNVPTFTKKVTVTVHEVTFANGEKWSPPP